MDIDLIWDQSDAVRVRDYYIDEFFVAYIRSLKIEVLNFELRLQTKDFCLCGFAARNGSLSDMKPQRF